MAESKGPNEPPGCSQHKEDKIHLLTVCLQPCIEVDDNYQELTETQSNKYQRFLLKKHSSVLAKLSELYGYSITEFDDDLNCTGEVKSLEDLHKIWENFCQKRDDINSDLTEHFKAIRCATAVNVDNEHFHVYTAVDEGSYQIGLIALKPKKKGFLGLPALKKSPKSTEQIPSKTKAAGDDNNTKDGTGEPAADETTCKQKGDANSGNDKANLSEQRTNKGGVSRTTWTYAEATKMNIDATNEGKETKGKESKTSKNEKQSSASPQNQAEKEKDSDKQKKQSDDSPQNQAENESDKQEKHSGFANNANQVKHGSDKKEKQSGASPQSQEQNVKESDKQEKHSGSANNGNQVQHGSDKKKQPSGANPQNQAQNEKESDKQEKHSGSANNGKQAQHGSDKKEKQSGASPQSQEQIVKESDKQEKHSGSANNGNQGQHGSDKKEQPSSEPKQDKATPLGGKDKTGQTSTALQSDIAAPSGQDKKVYTTFRLYIPKRINAVEATVNIKQRGSDDATAVSKHLTKVFDNSWESSPTIVESKLQMDYWYEMKDKGRFVKSFYEEKINRTLSCIPTILNVFLDDSAYVSTQNSDLLEGCWAYIQNVIPFVTTMEIENCITLLTDNKILQTTKSLYSHCRNQILKDAAAIILHANEIQIAFLIYILANCIPYHDFSTNFNLDKEMAVKCLNAFRCCHQEYFPSESKTEMYTICRVLCTYAFSRTSPFLSVTYFSNCMTTECLEYTIKSCAYTGKQDVSEIGYCFQQLLSNFTESKLKICILILEQINDFTHVPEIAKTVNLIDTLDKEVKRTINSKAVEICSHKAKEFLKQFNVFSPRSLQDIREFLDKITHEDVKTAVQQAAEERVSLIVKGKRSQWKESEVDSLNYILTESFLFSGESYIDLLEFIVNSETSHIFLKVVEKSQDLNEGVSKICIHWLKRTLDNTRIKFRNSREKRIAEQYHALGRMLELQAIAKNQRICHEMEEIVRDELVQMEISSVMKSAYEVEKVKCKGTEIFLAHIEKYVGHMKEKFKTGTLLNHFNIVGSTDIGCYSHYCYLMELLGSISMLPCTSLNTTESISVVTDVMKNIEFWSKIMKVHGKHSDKIKSHSTVIYVHSVLKEMLHGIQTSKISYSLSTELLPLMREMGITKLENFFINAGLLEKKVLVKCIGELEKISQEVTGMIMSFTALFKWLHLFDGIKTRNDIVHIEDLSELETKFQQMITDATNKDIMTVQEQLLDTNLQLTEVESLQVPMKMVCFHQFVMREICKHNILTNENDDIKMKCVDVNIGLDENNEDEALSTQSEEDNEKNEVAEGEIELMEDIEELEDTQYDNDEESVPDFVMPCIVTVEHIVNICSNNILPMFESFINENIYSKPTAMLDEMEELFSLCNMEEEVNNLEALTDKPVNETAIQHLNYVKDRQHINDRAIALSIMCKMFEIVLEEDDSPLATAIRIITDLEGEKNIMVENFWKCTSQFTSVTAEISNDLWDTIHELSRSQGLVEFLHSVKDEDLRNLIDAVEEHSEQFIQESTVSDLIRVKSFFLPILSNKKIDTAERLLKELKVCYEHAEKGLPQMLNTCSLNCNSLKALYMNVANRGEVTKEIVAKILQAGKIEFFIENDDISTRISYKSGERIISYHLMDLSDLHSRVLLISNTETIDEISGKDKRHNLQEFIKLCELVLEIYSLLQNLHQFGHFSFQDYHFETSENDIDTTLKELDKLYVELGNTQEEWQNELEFTRKKFYFLNFVHSKQLCILHDYFTFGKFKNEAISVMQFIKPHFSDEGYSHLLDEYHIEVDEETMNNKLEMLGRVLHNVLDSVGDEYTPFPSEKELWKQIENADARVHQGEIYLAHIDVQSMETIPVLLSLYANTTKVYPLPCEVLFCDAYTTWEELTLLINRCTYRPSKKKLHAIVGVEKLQYEVQFQLVQCINNLEQSDQEDYLLTIICRAVSHDNFLTSLSHLVHKAPALGDYALKACLQKACSKTYMVTSDLPGQGKTEHVYSKANEEDLGVVSVPISGPLTKQKLVNIVKHHPLNDFEILHLDIGNVDLPQMLDHFIFELLVLRCATAGIECVHLNTEHVAIEVGNTLNHTLRDRLLLCTSFKRTHKTWSDFQDFIVSVEPESAVQTVCAYLSAVDMGTLGTTDIGITENTAVLTSYQCCHLLRHFFTQEEALSFTLINVFLEVLADQLRKFSASQYFRISSLTVMLGDEKSAKNIRQDLVNAIITISKDFSCRSIAACKASQSGALEKLGLATETDEMISRIDSMVRWSDSNHLLVLFQSQDSQTVSSIYRDVSSVPFHIKKLLETQSRKLLPDFNKFSQTELQNILEKLVCPSLEKKIHDNTLYDSYALTPDNILKMVLVILRIRNRIPVILMGETGCGKTTLVKYLGTMCGIKLHVFQFHAGISEEVIMDTIQAYDNIAKTMPLEEHWVFLDEINTCDHLGLLKEIICNKSCDGHKLAANLVVIAACNPYRLRDENQVFTAGLEGKIVSDEFSRLVYRVHPLPESMIDYVWDYGTLHKNDETSYIERMVQGIVKEESKTETIVKLLSYSQDFIRENQKNNSAVSLRDIHRCRTLIKWFIDFLKEKDKYPRRSNTLVPGNFRRRAVRLALSHCYEVRLSETNDRLAYWEGIAEIGYSCSGQYMMEKVHAEQMDILNRMVLPKGIAKNAALRENVFVLFVCILNRIPVFLVGKPGCSKSLSVQLLRNNLRGADSEDEFLKTLDEIYTVSYQGSESSTSEGILKVFEKAEKYKEHCKEKNQKVLPVVILDEVGLAEISHFNPLKVLHSLLEPSTGLYPEVAVLGISNWALDAAKMNRAIHLSRPELTSIELFHTGKAIRDGLNTKWEDREGVLRKLANVYFEYQKKQTMKNFHGLRDYYSLVKYVCINYPLPNKLDYKERGHEILQKGIQRNFGGYSIDEEGFGTVFERQQQKKISNEQAVFGAEELIKENLHDKDARHLMVITSGDYSLGIIANILQEINRSYQIIFGSQFEEDLSEDYNYRILSKIILCMEQGIVLILKDLEGIYGSLYDMLNQNYTTVGSKKNCRIALGAHSNPMCVVHDDFRCIVMVDSDKVDYSDPPFLNRFEKQVLRFQDLLHSKEKICIGKLQEWVNDFSDIKDKPFEDDDAFLGFHQETLPSLLHHMQNRYPDITGDDLLNQCELMLLKTCPPDAILRLSYSKLASKKHLDIEFLQENFFTTLVWDSMSEYINKCLLESVDGKKSVVLTRSNINIELKLILEKLIDLQVERLSSFKSEKQLSQQITKFFNSRSSLLIIQCTPCLDSEHILLVKLLLENKWDVFAQKEKDPSVCDIKHIMVIMHLNRQDDHSKKGWQFDYTNNWEIVTIDRMDDTNYPIKAILGQTPTELLSTEIVSIDDMIKQGLVEAFSCMSYVGGGRSVTSIWEATSLIKGSEQLLSFMKQFVMEHLKKMSTTCSIYHQDNWQVKIACNTEQMFQGFPLVNAWKIYLHDVVKNELVLILWFLENQSLWHSYIDITSQNIPRLKKLWDKLFDEQLQEGKLDIDITRAPESMEITNPPLKLQFPFSNTIVSKLKGIGEMFALEEDITDIDCLEDIDPHYRTVVVDRYQNLVDHIYRQHFGLLERDGNESLLENAFECDADELSRLENDLHNIYSYSADLRIDEDLRTNITRLYIQSKYKACFTYSPHLELTFVVLTWTLQRKMIRKVLKLASSCGPLVQKEMKNALGVLIMNNENSSDSDVSDGTEVAEEILVNSLCSQLYPTSQYMQEVKNPDTWFHKASQLISFASKVSFFPPPLHFMRLCVDLYTLLPDPKAQFIDTLTLYSDTAVKKPSEPIEDNAQETHSETFMLPSANEESKGDDIPVTGKRCVIISEQKKQTKGEEILLDSLPGYKLFETSMNELLNKCDTGSIQRIVCLYFARCLDANSDSPILSEISDKLVAQTLPQPSMEYVGPIINRICYDLELQEIHTTYLNTNHENNEENVIDKMLTSIKFAEAHPLISLCLDVIEKCIGHVAQCGKSNLSTFQAAFSFIEKANKYSLQYLVCVAFCRLYLQWFYCFYNEHCTDLGAEQRNFLQRLDAILDLNPEDSLGIGSQMKLYLLKLFNTNSIKDLQIDVGNLATTMSSLNKIIWPSNEMVLGLGFNGLCLHKYYKTAKEFLENGRLEDIMQCIDQDSSILQGAIAALVEVYYWKLLLRPLTDTERDISSEILQKVNALPNPIESLLKGVLGIEPFLHRSLNVSSQWNYTKAVQGSFLLHVASFLAQLLVENEHTNVWILMMNSNIPSEVIQPGKCQYRINFARCVCGNMIFTSNNQPQKCVVCTNTKVEVEMYTEEEIQTKETIVQDIVNLCHQSTIIGGLALGMLSDKGDIDHHDIFNLKWTKIREQLHFTEKKMGMFLHVLLEDLRHVTSLIDIHIGIIDELLACNEKVFSFKCKILADVEESTNLYCVLEEVGDFHKINENDCLFTSLKTKRPTIDNLLSTMQITVDCNEEFTFLRLLLSEREKLSILNCLPSILNWYLTLHRSTHHKMSRKDAEKLTCYDFIHEIFSLQNGREAAFERFKQSWDILRESQIMHNLTSGLTQKEIFLGSSISECIVQDKQHPIYQIIKVLCKIQNDFLKKSAMIGFCGNKALGFMCRESSIVIPYSVLHISHPESFIVLKLTDELLNHCQNCTEYGNGEWIQYDFHRIEREMADSLLLGKNYLILDEQFPLTIYQNEMFHWCKHILTDIKKNVKQKPLPDLVRQRLKQGAVEQHGQQSFKALLNFLEVVISFMHRTGGSSTETIGTFTSTCGINEDIIQSDTIRKQLNTDICLCHVVAVYELIEEESAHVSIRSLPNQYSKPLNDTLKKQVNLFLKDHLPAKQIITAVRRYTVRYLSNGVNYAKPHESMTDLICHSSMWPCELSEDGCLANGKKLCKVFPGALLAEHTKALHDYVCEISKVNEDHAEAKGQRVPLKKFPSRKSKKKPYSKT